MGYFEKLWTSILKLLHNGLITFLKITLKNINKKGFSYLSKLEAGALVKSFLFHKPNLALFSSYFSQENKHDLFGKISDLIRIQISGSNQSLHFKFGLGMIISFHSFSNCQKEVTQYSRDPYAVSS